MELTRIDRGDFIEVRASGRLDEHWSGHLADNLNQVIRDGSHRVRLNLAAVSYLSSAGIRVLITLYKQLGEIGGSFAIVEPSDNVRTILDLTRLTPMLMGGMLAPGLVETAARAAERIERGNAVYEIFDRAIEAMECRMIGDASRLERGAYAEARAATFDRDTVGLGIGAFGSGFEECRDRYGAFLSVGWTAIYLPTDGSGVPDYLAAAEEYVPQVSVLYGLSCRGRFSAHLRFQAAQQARTVRLSEIAEASLEIAEAESAVVVMVAETAGLVGASLRRAPTTAAPGRFDHPEIRKWILFTGGAAFEGSLCLVVGIASRDGASPMREFLRPLGSGTEASGHFHAAAFPYQQLKKGSIDLSATIASLFEREAVQGMLHLIADEREAAGVGESEFVRGACWIAPVAKVGAA